MTRAVTEFFCAADLRRHQRLTGGRVQSGDGAGGDYPSVQSNQHIFYLMSKRGAACVLSSYMSTYVVHLRRVTAGAGPDPR